MGATAPRARRRLAIQLPQVGVALGPAVLERAAGMPREAARHGEGRSRLTPYCLPSA